MNSKVIQEIESLWTKRGHGIVDAMSLKYEVAADEPMRKIKVIHKDSYLPVEYYSVEALKSDEIKIRKMLQLKDSKMSTLKSIFKVCDAEESSQQGAPVIVRPNEKFGVVYFFYNTESGFPVVLVRRPSGDRFYQRLTAPEMLAEVLANQVGFLLVSDCDEQGVYTSPDKLLQFCLVEDNLKIIHDYSKS